MINILKKIKHRIGLLLNSQKTVPDIGLKRKVIESYGESFRPELFIETGTFLGDTVEYFKDKFDEIISIELSEELAEKAFSRFAIDSNVQIVQGDSGKLLAELLNKKHGRVLFWLDGHYSSEFFVKEEFIKTAKGDKNTPIENELDIVLHSSVEPLILIDDARLFTGKDDYPTIKAIRRKVHLIKPDFRVFVDTDIIHITPKVV